MTLAYAAPCVVVWTAFLLAYWPGLRSKDDVFEWQRVQAGVFGNDVPAAHELLVAAVSRLSGSPAPLAMLQIVILALAVGFVIAELERWRVGPAVRWLTTALFALSWVNGFMVIWVGRDTAFTIGTFVLAGILLRCVRTDGRWLADPARLAATAGVCLATALMRHNGPPVVIGVGLGLLLAFPEVRQRVALAAAGVAVAFLLVTRVVYPALGVQPMTPRIRLQYLLHHLAAHLAAGGRLDARGDEVITALAPRSLWVGGYDCYTVDPIVWSREFDATALRGREPDVVAAWWTAARERPGTVLRHQLCAGSLVWRIREVRAQRSRLFATPARFVDPAASKAPALAAALHRLRAWTLAPEHVWWAWRPALYLYVAVVLTGIAAWRTGTGRVWLILVPALVNSATWVVFGMAQHFRYQYPVYLIALLAPALLFVPRARCRPGPPSL